MFGLPPIRGLCNFLNICFIASVSILFLSCNDAQRVELAPGGGAAEIIGTNLQLKKASLSEVKEKVILINFWATWCGPCIEELPALQKLHDSLKDSGFSVIGVALDDSPEEIKTFVDKFNITYPILLDNSGDTKRNYDLKGLPESFFIDSKKRFIMFPDRGGLPAIKLIGPRDWAGAEMKLMIEKIVAAQ